MWLCNVIFVFVCITQPFDFIGGKGKRGGDRKGETGGETGGKGETGGAWALHFCP